MESKQTTFYQTIADQLIEQLKQGTAPWQRPWDAAGGSLLPFNPVTGKRYKGINVLALMAQNRSDTRWLTYKQAAAQGAQVQKGEKGTAIQYWQFTKTQQKKAVDGQTVVDENGKPVYEDVPLERPKVFYATVFNAEQMQGLPPQTLPTAPNWNPHERAEALLQASGAVIKHAPQDGAFYQVASDTIHLPEKGQFSSADAYYATVLHELGHWTGHPTRLDRDLSHSFGSEGYAKEELRAEIASLMLNHELGLGRHPDQFMQHAAYVQSWITLLHDQPLELYRAAAQAEKIQHFVLSQEHQQMLNQTQTQNEETLQISKTPIKAQQNAEPIAQSDRIFIQVPYKDKELAKGLGARWDRQQQSWYIHAGLDATLFKQWSVLPAAAASTEHAANEPVAARVYLAVPYDERQAAKAAGAKWDKQAKSWYITAEVALEKVQLWLPENRASSAEEQVPTQTLREEFAAALRSAGCIVEGEHPILDGNKHRIATEGDKKGETAGFYVIHTDGHPAGYIFNNRTGTEIKFRSKGYHVDPAQKAALQAQAEEKAALRLAEQTKLQEQTASLLQLRIETELLPIRTPTPYLQNKGLAVFAGIYTSAEQLKTFIPVTDEYGKIWSMQIINEMGSKRFAKNGRKSGCFHVVGGYEALASVPALVIAEGYATAASLSQALGYGTVTAFDSSNLAAVAKALHEQFPHKPIIIAGDDDKYLEATQGINPGKSKALQAAEAVGGKAFFPIFTPDENKEAQQQKCFTDFNDLATQSQLGLKGLQRQAQFFVQTVIQEHQKQQQQIRENQAQEKSVKTGHGLQRAVGL